MKEYDENEALDFIRARFDADKAKSFDDDEILNVIDIIWDYYDENGMLDINADIDEDDVLDDEALLAYVKKVVAKDRNSPFSIDDIEKIVVAELDYEDSLED